MDATPPSSTCTLCLGFDTHLDGDRIATLIDRIHPTIPEPVVVQSIRDQPTQLRFAGPHAVMSRLESTLTGAEVRSWLGAIEYSVAVQVDEPPNDLSSTPSVLVIDGDTRRSAHFKECMARAGINTLVVKRGRSARILIEQTHVRWDAVVLQHDLPDTNGLQWLGRMGGARLPCSVLVLDRSVCASDARAYRGLGAFRYSVCPTDPLEIIGRVNETIADTRIWRRLDPSIPTTELEPPRHYLDLERAADRLGFICDFSASEREVALMLLMGLRDLDIAQRLGRSERTAKRRVSGVLEKAKARNRSSLWAVLHRDRLALASLSELDPRQLGEPHVDWVPGKPSTEVSESPEPSRGTSPAGSAVPPNRPMGVIGPLHVGL